MTNQLPTVSIQGKAYVMVKDRVLAFNEKYQNGSIITEKITDEDNYLEIKATVTPDVDKPERKFTGHSQATWGESNINKTAALENAETSAVGRALAMMGIGVIESMASADEVKKSTTQPPKIGNPNFSPAKPSGKQLDYMMNLVDICHQAKMITEEKYQEILVKLDSGLYSSGQVSDIINKLKDLIEAGKKEASDQRKIAKNLSPSEAADAMGIDPIIIEAPPF